MECKLELDSIRIVGSIADESVEIADIQAVLQQERLELGRDGDFIGKSTTTLRANDSHVVKLHLTRRFSDEKVGFGWVGHHLKKECKAYVYHPARCWFIVLHDGRWVPGNITPRLLPVHKRFESLQEVGQEHLTLLSDIIAMYLDYAVRVEKRLDEGLSNFGLDGDQLYYLDDDIFEWDQFNALSALIAGWFRRYSTSWFNVGFAEAFGTSVNQHLKHYFAGIPGLDASQVMAEQLHGMFFPDGEIEEVAHAFIDVLRYGDSSCAEDKQQQFADLDDFATCFDEDEPIAILADVHANLPALQTVLTEVRHRGIERIFVLGDLVGYGPHPKECIDLLREVGAISLRGNHDHAVGTGDMVLSMTSSSTWTANWTLERVSEADRNYLRRLPLRMTHRPWLAVHGAPVDKTFFNAYVYNRTAEANVRWVKEQGYRFALHGHSHLQGVYAEQGDDVICVKDAIIDLEQYQTSLMCPGSVGQPRGGVVGAEFAILKPRSYALELLCLPYEVNEVIQDMIIEGFPEQLMKRLKTGN